MKNTKLLLLIIPLTLLSSCNTTLFNPKTVTESIGVYDLDNPNLTETSKSLTNAYVNDIEVKFLENEPYVPYLTVEQYASLYEHHFVEGAYNRTSVTGNNIYWNIYSDEGLCFRAVINTYEKTIKKAGDIEYALKEEDNPRDLRALNYGMHTSGSYADQGSTYESYDFKSGDPKRFSIGRTDYFPLGFFDIAFSESSGIYFTYNYKHIFETHDVDNYTDKQFVDEGRIYTFDTQMNAANNSLIMPEYLIRYNASLFLFLMDNFYGLKENLKIKSMKKYFDKLGYYKNLYSSSNSERNYAYSYLLNSFDDNHTALISQNGTWGAPSPARSGDGIIARYNLNVRLNEIRNNYYDSLGKTPNKDFIISDDNKTAMFMFDRFYFGTSEQVFNPDGTIKDDAGDYDHFIQITNALLDLKNNYPTVQNVILDIATNGGGVVGVMMKLLSLLSRDNDSSIFMRFDKSDQIIEYKSFVDINNDGEYTLQDSFGRLFNFYILTSDCSFSCGNAFPCYAQKEGIAKIIGQTSGGGECAVAIHYLPNSEYIYHSSNLHLGYYDYENKQFIGFESGATPDYPIETVDADFFNINKLNALIS